MKGTTALVLVALLLCGLAPSRVAGKVQVQAVFAFTGVCFPVKENLVTSVINIVVNPITNSPWGTATQSSEYESLCARLPDGCTDIPGSGTGRRAPAPAATPPSPADSPQAAPAPAPADSSPDYSSDRGARGMPPPLSDGSDSELSRGGSASSGSGSLLEEDGALADLISGSISSPKPPGGATHALGNRRLLWLEGQGRDLLQDKSCSGKKWYLYLDTTDPADPEAMIQMIKDSINTGDFISRMDGIPGLQPESVILKDIKTVDLPDDPPAPPTDDTGHLDGRSPPVDYDYDYGDYGFTDIRIPSASQQVEQVQAIFVLKGPCFPVSDSQVTEIILAVNGLTGVPWGTPEQSSGFNSLCKKLAKEGKQLEGCPTDGSDTSGGDGSSGRWLLKENACKNDKWYLYLDTTNPPDYSDTIMWTLRQGIIFGDLMEKLAATTLEVEGVDLMVLEKTDPDA